MKRTALLALLAIAAACRATGLMLPSPHPAAPGSLAATTTAMLPPTPLWPASVRYAWRPVGAPSAAAAGANAVRACQMTPATP